MPKNQTRTTATTMTTHFPTDAQQRKSRPMYSGLVAYFPDALAAVSHLSWLGNQQHHPDAPLHWDKEKSPDELDALMRHLTDEEWVHVAWRALANLQRQLDAGWQPWELRATAPELIPGTMDALSRVTLH